MEITNRKLLSRRVALLSFALVVSGLPGVYAAEQVAEQAAETGQAIIPGGLSFEEEQARKAKFAEQDAKLAAAKGGKFEETVAAYREVIGELNNPEHNFGTLGQERKKIFLRELEALKTAQGELLLHNARKAAADKLYPNAIQLASEAMEVSTPEREIEGVATVSPLKEEVEDLIDFCRKRFRTEEKLQDASIEAVNPQYVSNRDKIKRLYAEAKTFKEGGRLEEAISRLEDIYIIDPFHRDTIQMMNDIYKAMYTAGVHRRAADIFGIFAAANWKWVEPVFPANIPPPPPDATIKNPAAHGVLTKLEKIVFPRIEFEDMNVLTVIRYLNDRSKLYDTDKEGVNVTAGFDTQVAERLGRVTMSLSRIPMGEVIRYVCQDTGLKYRVEAGGVLIGPNVDEMQIQFFQVRGDLISSITGDDSAEAADGGAAVGGITRAEGVGGGGGGGGGGETDTGAAFLARGATGKRPSVTAIALMRYFQERGVPFGEGSSISYDKRASKLIVRNTLENLRRLDELIRQLDAIQTPLVMVEIKGIEINELDLQELGFDWAMDALTKNMTMQNGQLTLTGSQGWAFGMGSTRSPNIRGNGFTSVSDSTVINNMNIFPALFGSQKIFGSDVPFNLYLTVNALNQNTRTETLAAPKVMTTSGNKASVEMVKSYWFPTDWDTYEIETNNGVVTISVPTPDFEEYPDIGISFDVTPVVNPDNYTISLEVNPTVKNFLGKDEYPIYVKGILTYYEQNTNPTPGSPERILVNFDTVTLFNVWMPIVSVRNLKVNVTVYDGETIVLGGMIDSQHTSRTDKWPILGDLPFIGRFFSSQADEVNRSNLLLFVTTRLVNNDGIPIRRNLRHGAPDFGR